MWCVIGTTGHKGLKHLVLAVQGCDGWPPYVNGGLISKLVLY